MRGFPDFCWATAPESYGATGRSLVPRLCLGMHIFRALPGNHLYSHNQVNINQTFMTGVLSSTRIAPLFGIVYVIPPYRIEVNVLDLLLQHTLVHDRLGMKALLPHLVGLVLLVKLLEEFELLQVVVRMPLFEKNDYSPGSK